MYGTQALLRLLEYADVRTILDIGSGTGAHAAHMRRKDRIVRTNSLVPPADYVGRFETMPLPRQFDAIWACHVFEHVLDPHCFLSKCHSALREGGILAITVPPLKNDLVGGHVNLFTPASLLYRLVLAGFDCSEARLGTYGYNISVLVRRKQAHLPTDLVMDRGDIERLASFFPCHVEQSVDGRLPNIRW